MMNRREFLKLCGVSAVVASLPRFSLADYPNFDSGMTYGDYVVLSEDLEALSEGARVKVFEVVEMDMKHHIPPEYRDRVSYIVHNGGDDYLPTVAWKYKGTSQWLDGEGLQGFQGAVFF